MQYLPKEYRGHHLRHAYGNNQLWITDWRPSRQFDPVLDGNQFNRFFETLAVHCIHKCLPDTPIALGQCDYGAKKERKD